MNNLQLTKIGDFADVKSGKRLPKGHTLVNYQTQYPYIRLVDIEGNRISKSDMLYLEKNTHEKIARYIVNDHDVCLAIVGNTIGLVFTVDKKWDGANLTENAARLTNFKGVEPHYVFYYLRSRDGQDQIISRTVGSAQGKLPLYNIKNMEVPLPPLSEQRAIAGILGALDDKIELNRRMNATLESLARAVFRRWFVENEEVGNWKISQIGEIADVIDCLHSKKPERQEVGEPFLQLSNILDNGLLDVTDIYFITKEDYDFWISRIEASPGDCVVTNVGRVGAIAQIPEGFKAALGRNMTAIRCKKEYPYPTFLIECLMSDTMRQEINNKTDSGTILDALNVKNIPLLQFVLPPHGLLQKFEEQIRPIRAKMEANLKESRTLGSLRDSLLPKLMRGEVRVKDVEKL